MQGWLSLNITYVFKSLVLASSKSLGSINRKSSISILTVADQKVASTGSCHEFRAKNFSWWCDAGGCRECRGWRGAGGTAVACLIKQLIIVIFSSKGISIPKNLGFFSLIT